MFLYLFVGRLWVRFLLARYKNVWKSANSDLGFSSSRLFGAVMGFFIVIRAQALMRPNIALKYPKIRILLNITCETNHQSTNTSLTGMEIMYTNLNWNGKNLTGILMWKFLAVTEFWSSNLSAQIIFTSISLWLQPYISYWISPFTSLHHKSWSLNKTKYCVFRCQV